MCYKSPINKTESRVFKRKLPQTDRLQGLHQRESQYCQSNISGRSRGRGGEGSQPFCYSHRSKYQIALPTEHPCIKCSVSHNDNDSHSKDRVLEHSCHRSLATAVKMARMSDTGLCSFFFEGWLGDSPRALTPFEHWLKLLKAEKHNKSHNWALCYFLTSALLLN